MAELEWQNPPQKQPRRGEHWDETIRELRKNPGKWAVISREWKSSSAPSAIRKAGIETTARRNPDEKTYTVYCRAPVVVPKKPAVTQRPVAGGYSKFLANGK